MSDAGVAERLLRRDRAIVVAALASVVIASWLYLFAGAGMDMREMDDMPMPDERAAWTAPYAAIMAAMWVVMMGAMMLPSAAPMILLHATIGRRRREQGTTPASTGLFVLGYIAIWAAFSAVATALQWRLADTALLGTMMQVTSKVLAASLLIAAGVYQWTPLKQACLRKCRSPLDFVLGNWREGAWGSFVMGVQHGAYCLGCCWLLMLLLFVGGLMNLVWVAGLAAFVLVEKLAPYGHWAGRAAGIALVAWGGVELWVTLI